MQRIRLLGVTLIAIFTVGVLTAASASATEPTKILPEPTATSPLTGTSKSGPGTLLTVAGHEVTCKKDTDTFSFTTPNEGTFPATFEECKTVVAGVTLTCTGESDTEGKILLLGTGDYLLALRMVGTSETETTLVAALVFKFTEFSFTCKTGIISAVVKVRGCAAALAEPVEKLAEVTKDVFEEFKSGESRILQILPKEATKEENCLTETSLSGGAFELSAQKGSDENEKFEQGGKKVAVLLMNP